MENFYFTEIYNMHEIVIEYRIVLMLRFTFCSRSIGTIGI